MSSTLPHVPEARGIFERRFYPRIMPKKPIPICVSLRRDTELLLVNVGENGLLVSTPEGLPCNFVARIAIPLDGFLKPVQVTARVVWTNASRKLMGIQLLDLCEEDRQKIRNWGARLCATPLLGEQRVVASVTKPHIGTHEDSTEALALANTANPEDPPTLTSAQNFGPELPTQAATGVAAKMKWPLFVTALCLAGAFLLRSGALENPFGLSQKSPHEKRPVATPVVNKQQPLSIPGVPEPSPAMAPIAATTASGIALTREPAPEPPAHAPSKLGGDPKTVVSQSAVRQSQRKESHDSSVPAQNAPTPNSLMPASTQADAESDLPSSSVIGDANPSSTSDSSTTMELAPETSLAPPPPLAKTEAPPGLPPPRSDANASIVPPNHTAVSPLKPESPVIQMDVPSRQLIEVHLPKGNRDPILNLPGAHSGNLFRYGTHPAFRSFAGDAFGNACPRRQENSGRRFAFPRRSSTRSGSPCPWRFRSSARRGRRRRARGERPFHRWAAQPDARSLERASRMALSTNPRRWQGCRDRMRCVVPVPHAAAPKRQSTGIDNEVNPSYVVPLSKR